MTALSSGSLLHIWTSCLKAWCPCWVHGSLPGWLGTVLFSVGSCFTHRDAQALLETQNKCSCLKVQPYLSALRTPKEGSFLLREIMTNLQGPQFSEVLSSSAHSFIHFLVKYCTYRDLLAMCQVLSHLQCSHNQDRHSLCQFDSWGQKGLLITMVRRGF